MEVFERKTVSGLRVQQVGSLVPSRQETVASTLNRNARARIRRAPPVRPVDAGRDGVGDLR